MGVWRRCRLRRLPPAGGRDTLESTPRYEVGQRRDFFHLYLCDQSGTAFKVLDDFSIVQDPRNRHFPKYQRLRVAADKAGMGWDRRGRERDRCREQGRRDAWFRRPKLRNGGRATREDRGQPSRTSWLTITAVRMPSENVLA